MSEGEDSEGTVSVMAKDGITEMVNTTTKKRRVEILFIDEYLDD